MINCEEDKKLGLHNVAKHYYTPGMHEPVTGRNFALNRETAHACQDPIKAGVTLHRTPDEILINFLTEWEKIQSEYAAKDPFYKKVIDSQRKYAELIVPFKLSWYPPYDLAGKFYWKDRIYLKSGGNN